MKKLLTTTLLFAAALFAAKAQVPSQAEDVMLQAFYWNSHSETKWATLTSQADEIGSTFTLVWLPPASAAEGGGSSNMGYHPYQWPNLSSSWGNKSTLTALIQALHNKNCKVIADIVANHHAGNNACCSFPTETFGSYGSFQFDASQITQDDESGSGTGAKDAGYGEWQCGSSGGYCAARDLDHSNSNVQNHVIAYLKWMKNDIGYDGWRYDLVKGYLGKYTKMYNEAAGAYMSVGEYYDANYDALLNWVKETSYTSMVFDFAFHNAMVEWGGGSDYSKLSWLDGSTPRPAGLCHAAASRKYAVTFIDNHDTDEKHTDGNWPYRGDWEKANAVMLAAPGIPCVFWRHWVACKDNIKKMVAARRAAGIHSESDVVVNNTNGYYQATATGKKGKLICFVGSGWSAPSGYTLACSGNGWAYYTDVVVPTNPVVTMTPAGGYVGQGGTVTLTTTKGTIYYTTDGTTPSASSTPYSSPISITVNNTTIKAIAIDGSTKSDIVSGTFLTEKPAGLTVQFKAPSSWSAVALYVWDANENKILGEWPGKTLTKSGDYYTYTITESDVRPLNIIFNDNNNGHQTVDLSASTDACWDGSNGTSAKITPTSCGETPTPGESVTVALAQYSQWTTVALYAWDDSGALLGEWPGETLTLSGGYYSKTISSYTGTLYIIFNNGNNKEQTQNITVSGSTCYEINTSDKGTDSYGNTTYGVNTSTSCITDVEEQEAGSNGVVLYPNPTTGELNISGGEFVKATVTNLAGQSFKYSVSGGSLNVSNLAKGLYIIDLESASGDVTKSKFIKK